MQIFAKMREDDVRCYFALELFEALLDFGAAVGEKAVLEFLDYHCLMLNAAEELQGAVPGFACADGIRTENKPEYADTWAFSSQAQQRSPATDFDVVAMSANAKNCLEILWKEVEHLTISWDVTELDFSFQSARS